MKKYAVVSKIANPQKQEDWYYPHELHQNPETKVLFLTLTDSDTTPLKELRPKRTVNGKWRDRHDHEWKDHLPTN